MTDKKSGPRKSSKVKGGPNEIYGIALFALSIIIFLGLFASDNGVLGRLVSDFLKDFIGIGRYIFPFFLFFAGLLFVTDWADLRREMVSIGLTISFLSLIALIHLGTPYGEELLASQIDSYGGYLGGVLVYASRFLIGNIGSYVAFLAALSIGILISTGFMVSELFVIIRGGLNRLFHVGKGIKERETLNNKTRLINDQGEIISGFDDEVLEAEFTTRTVRQKSSEAAAKNTIQIKMDTHGGEFADYELPPLSLLKLSVPRSQEHKRDVQANLVILEQVLKNFDVDARIDKVTKGPTVTRYEIQLASGVKVNRILNLSDDIALALATSDIRILAPIPGKSAIGIEVPNKQRELVTIGDILSSEEFATGSVLQLGLGKDIAGQSIIADLADMPHLMIAGATGSGKSVCINDILISFLMRAKPNQLKMILIDPKRIELNLYDGLPHLITPVVVNPKEASSALLWTVKEMESRLDLLADAGTRNIDGYNAYLAKESRFEDFMPYIVIVVDELADLMMVAPGEVEDSICRLAQLARAVGIHLIIATQRPSVDVITGLIKANITSRIAFAVSSQIDSRVILDSPGAEKLVGKGDMLFLSPKTHRLKRLQCAFVTEEEVELVTNFVKGQAKPDYKSEILKRQKSKFALDDYDDDLFDDALELVVSTGMASVSMLQRRLRIGYTRAARLMDILEEKGIVGVTEGSRPRPVLFTEDDLERLKGDK
ncbi:MAG: DNA translocase FtsK 4TM domain-containing protein [Actinomycetota bacterium]|nr:DNA translocase FtsK 4TM domain-containing protein [Actinomycetota bacterium]